MCTQSYQQPNNLLTLENSAATLLAVSAVGIQAWPADADRLCAQRQSLHDVGSRPDSSVDHDVDLGEQVWSVAADLI